MKKHSHLVYTGISLLSCAVILAFVMGSNKIDTSRYNALAIVLQAAIIAGAIVCFFLFVKKN